MSEQKTDAYYETLDKRTKEYKDWKAKKDESLLGNKIEAFTEKTGIKKAVETVTKAVGIEDCGCKSRKEKFNNFHEAIRKKFIHKQPKLMTEEEYVFIRDFFAVNRTRVSAEEQISVFKVYNRVFEMNQQPTNCPSCWKKVARQMQKLLEFQRA